MFSVSALGGSTFFAGHIVKDTSAIRKQLDLDARLTFTNAVSSREYLNAMQVSGVYGSVESTINWMLLDHKALKLMDTFRDNQRLVAPLLGASRQR